MPHQIAHSLSVDYPEFAFVTQQKPAASFLDKNGNCWRDHMPGVIRDALPYLTIFVQIIDLWGESDEEKQID